MIVQIQGSDALLRGHSVYLGNFLKTALLIKIIYVC